MKGIIRLGDATTHGGVVVQASSDMVIEGKPAALVGDLVSCPIPAWHQSDYRRQSIYVV